MTIFCIFASAASWLVGVAWWIVSGSNFDKCLRDLESKAENIEWPVIDSTPNYKSENHNNA